MTEPGESETPQEPPLALADVQDALLDAETLNQLFFDLSALAQMIEVRVKSGAREHASDATHDLTTARSALLAGSALQLRYAYRGEEWIDTLMPTAEGVRLIRIRPPWS